VGGRTGRARKPLSLMEAQGTINRTRVRQQGRLSQALVRGIPDYPPEFPDALKPSFDYYAHLLNDRGVLTSQDGAALSELVYTHDQLLRARAALDALGDDIFVLDSKGRLRGQVLLRQVRVLGSDLMRLLARFGLTPRDRERVGVIAKSEPNPVNDAWSRLDERTN
jgi:phage terminase small subunit